MNPTYANTCSLSNTKPYCVTFALTYNYMQMAAKEGKHGLQVIYDEQLEVPSHGSHIEWIPSIHPLFEFICYHNRVNAYKKPAACRISQKANISPEVCIGYDGMRYARSPSGEVVSLKHMGNVVIEDEVDIGPMSTIARATFDTTFIGKRTKIGVGVHVGHNSQIGEGCIIIDGTVLLGSVHIGYGCYISGNSTIRNGVHIANNTFIAMGSVVVKDIEYSGLVWAGVPAKPLRTWDGNFI